MSIPEPPPEIVALADARADARRARDFETADALKARIEAAGWRVIDAASLYTLERAAAPDVADGAVTRYGSSSSVPSRLGEAAVGRLTVVLVADGDHDALARSLRSVVEGAPDGTQVVIVANAPDDADAGTLAAIDAVDPGAPGVVTEVVWTSSRLGAAAALNAGIRRATAPVVVLLESGIDPGPGLLAALAEALEDETVAVAGPVGLLSLDLRTFEAAPADAVDVDAIGGTAVAFRRTDYVARGPLDEHFEVADSLDVWWSLVLRDQDPDASDDVPARRALQVGAAGFRRSGAGEGPTGDDPGRDRAAKRNFYRVLKRFATRRDLLVAQARGHDRENPSTGP